MGGSIFAFLVAGPSMVGSDSLTLFFKRVCFDLANSFSHLSFISLSNLVTNCLLASFWVGSVVESARLFRSVCSLFSFSLDAVSSVV